ncbi:MAG: M23 family metallopeptidase [Erysipelotrichaceae bacterium]|nr:M23 family metallopeptidase [Erysipelotrichaceae bacterium]
MNSYLNDKKRQKLLHKKYLNDKKEKKKHIKFIDKVFIRIFFSSLVLLFLTYFQTIENGFMKNIKNNINFLSISTKIDNLFGSNLFNKGELTVYSQTFYEEVKFENEVNYITNSSFAGVETLVDGVVIKIEKINNFYNVYIQSSDNIIYKYCNLESIDIHIYSYVKQKDVIGKARLINDLYQFELYIIKDNKFISYYENSED